MFPRLLPENYRFPEVFRSVFIATIGATIGAKITWDVVQNLPQVALSMLALTAFVPLSQLMNFQIFHRIGGYDRPTAFYAGAPGGLVEAIVAGESAGADVQVLAVQQFLRIIAVITLLPVGMSLVYGHPVGSSAGMSLNRSAVGITHIPEVIGAALLGLVIFRRLHVPAAQLIGPLICAAVLTLSGLAVIEAPQWLISGCQIVIGTSLGTRFAGMNLRRLVKATWLSLLSVGAMIAVGLAMALAIHPLTGQALDVLLISFSPGGVTEMALVALSLNANPAVVTLHHLYRIILTVVMLGFVGRRDWLTTPRP
ncbi:AbrB family transcriptional regulator [Pseudooceanicola algae]|uniref:AbrB family transcriptional regulator n=1 Tax=Pseudooceanicola algae TaxID=1537215 RepID=UPI001E4801E0|nr:AbrB family transcriptional regulator [Pseudooceanicola algae]